ncbi:radical SAM protein [Clostridium senegalense]|uniref:Radical SAM protein n=1 Tax=Clostridium senegalense TaxID=1465809 RepID=A0A6M0H5U4_9CLOT|nr:radical SAM protein [Clostridium senegalense]
MDRYNLIKGKNEREIVLLKGSPCVWGKCTFCDYIHDNDENEKEMIELNKTVLKNVTGELKVLEVINSGSVFELPKETLNDIKKIVEEKGIKKLFFESHWSYRYRLDEIREFFNVPIIFKCGIETFDNYFRNKVLKKGAIFSGPKEVRKYFESICLLIGIEGQTKEMIDKDIEYLLKYFSKGCVNIFVENTTYIKRDENLIGWFQEKYSYLQSDSRVEVLFENTDFGVGE